MNKEGGHGTVQTSPHSGATPYGVIMRIKSQVKAGAGKADLVNG